MSNALIDTAILHRQASARPLDLDSLPWADGVNPENWFAPESMTHLLQSPSYRHFNETEKKLYARTVAFAKAELFIYFEEHLLAPVIQRLISEPQRFSIEPGLLSCLRDFHREELQHTEMFWRLLETAAPELYPTRNLRIYRSYFSLKLLPGALRQFPDTLILWVWLAMFIEELTVDLYRQYRQDDRVEPLFEAVYQAHMMDEMRHVSIDHHVLEALWDTAPRWLRVMNVGLLDHIVSKVTSPVAAPRAAIEEVLLHSPHLWNHRDEFFRDIAALGQNMAYQEAHYSRETLPRTFGLLDRYPEMRALRKGFPAYRPRSLA
ncbi:MAG: diiron oxygenase [Candidatus Sericytochromatia bacterium]|nr:diiron oxygenase [Candidatus Sericytochromatia bacterium]